MPIKLSRVVSGNLKQMTLITISRRYLKKRLEQYVKKPLFLYITNILMGIIKKDSAISFILCYKI